jgi:hypothetical protein
MVPRNRDFESMTSKWTSAVKFSQSLRSLEGDPRFKAFLRKMNLPDD